MDLISALRDSDFFGAERSRSMQMTMTTARLLLASCMVG